MLQQKQLRKRGLRLRQQRRKRLQQRQRRRKILRLRRQKERSLRLRQLRKQRRSCLKPRQHFALKITQVVKTFGEEKKTGKMELGKLVSQPQVGMWKFKCPPVGYLPPINPFNGSRSEYEQAKLRSELHL
mmetsp:Transcript_30853/g.56113  ORF Transcript_30853/g.56113 Transcript_30853/m.56113 type:complete len:130 (-) Transcript_30853:18-407(-)